jgi:uncharacterized protein YecE (DUF72 family)
MIRIGCAGFPVGRDRYWSERDFSEAATGEHMPQDATLEGWRADVPKGAELAVQAYRLITHSPSDPGFPAAGKKLPKNRQLLCGGFRESLEVHEAWQATRAAAEALGARLVVFETPGSFVPGPDSLRDLYAFFRRISRAKLTPVWAPRGLEWDRLADKVCGELGLERAYDPLRQKPPAKGRFRYARVGVPRGSFLDVDDLSTIARSLEGGPAYVVFSHRAAFPDAARLQALLEGRR